MLRQNKLDESKELLHQALDINDENHDIYFMLGKIYKISNNLEDAIRCFEWSIDIEPKFQLAYVELFESLFRIKRLNDVVVYVKKATENFGESSDFYYQIANYYLDIDDVITAKKYLELSINVNEKFAKAYEILANIYLDEKNKEEAIKYFKKLEELEPNNPVLHLLYGLEGKMVEGIQNEYAKKLFDYYADNFDKSLKNLDYSVPDNLLQLLKEKTKLTEQKINVLDLGCGTGMFGEKIKPYANKLVGVDLSEKMLGKAKELNVYDKLENSDLIDALYKEEKQSYDLISSTDVFIYVGKLEETFVGCDNVLKENGLFAFSLESLEHYDLSLKQDYKLLETGRYAHALSYVEKLAKENNLSKIAIETKQIRLDNGKPIMGYLCIFQKNNYQTKDSKIVIEEKPIKKGFFSKIFGN